MEINQEQKLEEKNDTNINILSDCDKNTPFIQNILSKAVLNPNTKQLMAERKYLDESKIENKMKIAIASFPRSGNTMLRTICENTTGIFTGDDMIFEYVPKEEEGLLSHFGLGKESVVSNVLFVKTHYPNMNFNKSEFNAKGVILIARNPFDAFDSFYHFSRTNSHYLKVSDEERKIHQETFDKFMVYLSRTFKEYNDSWFMNLIKQVPTYVIKYEDFIKDKKTGAIDMWDFIYTFKPHPDYLNNRTKEEINSILSTNSILETQSYKPGSGGKDNYKSLLKNYFNKTQIKFIIEENYDYLKFFGYLDDFKQIGYEIINEIINEVELEKKDWKQKYGIEGAQNYKELNEKCKLGFIENNFKTEKGLLINDSSKDLINHYYQLLNYWNMSTFITDK